MSGITSLVSQSAAAGAGGTAWNGDGKLGWELGMHVDSVTSVGAVLVGSDNVSVSVAMSWCCGGGDVCEADDERVKAEVCRPVSLEPWTSAGELRAHRDLGVA